MKSATSLPNASGSGNSKSNTNVLPQNNTSKGTGHLTAQEKAASVAGTEQNSLAGDQTDVENNAAITSEGELSENTEKTASANKKSSASILPSFMSILAVFAGGAYKIWSRRLF